MYKAKKILIILKKFLYFIIFINLIEEITINKTNSKKTKMRKINNKKVFNSI